MHPEADDQHLDAGRLLDAARGPQAALAARAPAQQQGRLAAGPFDLIFIDADKPGYTEYLHAAIELGRPGTLIVADNVVREGRILAPGDDEAAAGIARFNAALAADDRVTGVVTQLVGDKGHDGIALAVVR